MYTIIKKIPTSFSFQCLHMIQHNGKINLVLKRAVLLQLYCSLYRKVRRLLLSFMKYTDVVSYFGTFYRNQSMRRRKWFRGFSKSQTKTRQLNVFSRQFLLGKGFFKGSHVSQMKCVLHGQFPSPIAKPKLIMLPCSHTKLITARRLLDITTHTLLANLKAGGLYSCNQKLKIII